MFFFHLKKLDPHVDTRFGMDNHTLGLDVTAVGDRRKVEADSDLGLRVESIGGFHKQPALADVLHSANAEVRDGPAFNLGQQ